MSSSLNVWSHNADDLLAAESAAMIREQFIERYGALDHLIGSGSSGGSYQALQIADNYPGILSAVVVQDALPEAATAVVNYVTDAKLLTAYLDSLEPDQEWTDEQKRAVTGFRFYRQAQGVAGDNRINPKANCDMVPPGQRYDPRTNPQGVRCDMFSHTRNAFGTDPETSLPYRPLDNNGVQYGLAALEDGRISVDQFLNLNESVGGFDQDGISVHERTVGDAKGIQALYQTGRLLNGGGGLADIPIIDRRTYLDENAGGGDIHIRYHSLSLRQRLIDANGAADNLVSVVREASHPSFTDTTLPQLEQWLRDIETDTSNATGREKVIAHRPAALADGCYRRDGDRSFVAQALDRSPDSLCEQQYPSGSFPREVAGDSIAAAVEKCQVAAPVRSNYQGVEFTDEQWIRLRAVLPDGVCDYSVPGAEQQGLAGTWIRFKATDWEVMPTPPQSVALPGDVPEPPPAWRADQGYAAGDLAGYEGKAWKATWWTRGETPGATWGAWQEIAKTPDGTAVWTPTRIFTNGDTAEHDGHLFCAKWWTRNETPGDPNGPWERQ